MDSLQSSSHVLLKYHKEQVIIFAILVIVPFLIDIASFNTQECLRNLEAVKKAQLILLLLIHHIVFTFGNFGWLFTNKYLLYIYIIAPIFMLAYWKLNDNKCDLSVWANQMCGWNGDKYFNDVWNMIGLKQHPGWHKVYHKVFLFSGIAIAIYKLVLLHRHQQKFNL